MLKKMALWGILVKKQVSNDGVNSSVNSRSTPGLPYWSTKHPLHIPSAIVVCTSANEFWSSENACPSPALLVLLTGEGPAALLLILGKLLLQLSLLFCSLGLAGSWRANPLLGEELSSEHLPLSSAFSCFPRAFQDSLPSLDPVLVSIPVLPAASTGPIRTVGSAIEWCKLLVQYPTGI